MAMRAQQAADEAQSVKTSSQRLPAPKKFVVRQKERIVVCYRNLMFFFKNHYAVCRAFVDCCIAVINVSMYKEKNHTKTTSPLLSRAIHMFYRTGCK